VFASSGALYFAFGVLCLIAGAIAYGVWVSSAAGRSST
jgi:hypothetical protein